MIIQGVSAPSEVYTFWYSRRECFFGSFEDKFTLTIWLFYSDDHKLSEATCRAYLHHLFTSGGGKWAAVLLSSYSSKIRNVAFLFIFHAAW